MSVCVGCQSLLREHRNSHRGQTSLSVKCGTNNSTTVNVESLDGNFLSFSVLSQPVMCQRITDVHMEQRAILQTEINQVDSSKTCIQYVY